MRRRSEINKSKFFFDKHLAEISADGCDLVEVKVLVDDESPNERTRRIHRLLEDQEQESLLLFGYPTLSEANKEVLSADAYFDEPIVSAWYIRPKEKKKESPTLASVLEEEEGEDEYDVFDLSEYHNFIRRMKSYFRRRKAISVKLFCEEIKVSYPKLLEYMGGQDIMPDTIREKVENNLIRYGFKK